MFFAALALAGALTAQPPQQAPSSPTQVDDIVVAGRPVGEQIRSFLDDVALPDPNLRVARFHNNVCVGAVNMRGEMAQYVVDRISDVGDAIGLEVSGPGCKPNVLVIAADDGAAFAKGLVDSRRRAFVPGGSGMVRTYAALDRFQNTDAGIRWWHVSMPVDARSGAIATRLPGEDPPFVTGAGSRLRSEIRNDINRVIIILDFNKLQGLNSRQIADFAAMVAFSQVDLDSDFSGYDSILSLMSDREYEGMSEWDMAYLKALYSAELTGVSKTQQRGEIAALMERAQVGPRARRKAVDAAVDPS